MLRTLLRAKIHRAMVTQADLHYEGSIGIDQALLDEAGIAPFEKVEIYDITNGNRLETYAIPGEAGSGEICINGAAARLVDPQDIVIICCYGNYDHSELKSHLAKIVLVDKDNRVVETQIRSAAETLSST